MPLKDIFKNDVEESPEPQEVSVNGTLPAWLCGTYYKPANGKYKLPSGFEMNHLIDGYAIIYQYKIQNNKVTFRSKFLNTDAYNKAIELGKPYYAEFGTRRYANPNSNFLTRMMSQLLPGDFSDNTFLNTITYRGNVYASNGSCYLHQIDPNTLQSIAKVDLSKAGIFGCTPCFLQDSKDILYNIGTSFRPTMKWVALKIEDESANENRALLPKRDVKIMFPFAAVSTTSMPVIQSFGLTENYMVYVELPYTINMLTAFFNLIKGKTPSECTQWNPQELNKFHVINRKTGECIGIKYTSETFFYLQILNAYEENDFLVIDILAANSPAFLDYLTLSKLRNGEYYKNEKDVQVLRRFVLPIGNISATKLNENVITSITTTATAKRIGVNEIFLTPEILFDFWIDMPRINGNFITKKYRYVYCPIFNQENEYQKTLCKLDLETKEIKVWRGENENACATQPIFVANPDGKDEDDGVLATAVADTGNPNHSWFVFLDAKTFTQIGVAEINSGINVGNQGTFVWDKN